MAHDMAIAVGHFQHDRSCATCTQVDEGRLSTSEVQSTAPRAISRDGDRRSASAARFSAVRSGISGGEAACVHVLPFYVEQVTSRAALQACGAGQTVRRARRLHAKSIRLRQKRWPFGT